MHLDKAGIEGPFLGLHLIYGGAAAEPLLYHYVPILPATISKYTMGKMEILKQRVCGLYNKTAPI